MLYGSMGGVTTTPLPVFLTAYPTPGEGISLAYFVLQNDRKGWSKSTQILYRMNLSVLILRHETGRPLERRGLMLNPADQRQMQGMI